MWSPFRKKHLTSLLEISLKQRNSLDSITHKYFKENRSLGSKDRLWLKKGLYDIIKWRELLASYKLNSTKDVVDLYTEKALLDKDHSHLPSHVQVSFPKWIFLKLVDSLGYEKAMEFCCISNEVAPICIRVNHKKISKDQFYKKYRDEMQLSLCENAPNGFILKKNLQFNGLEAFKKGLFEPQDEASQMIGELIQAKPGMQILDYCAASGGKTLTFAPDMDGKGQVHLHDVRQKPLIDAKKRLKRAGIENFQLYFDNEKRMNRLKGKMDVVLVDAPCSCSGTFRRRPDHKWMLTEEKLEDLIALQREICLKASEFLKPGGVLIYATCSALSEENEDQVVFLSSRKDLEHIKSEFIPLKSGGSDAMFAASFKKNLLV